MDDSLGQDARLALPTLRSCFFACGSSISEPPAACVIPFRATRPSHVKRIRTRFLVTGSGVAGVQTAWRSSELGERVMVLTKRSLFDSATAYTQGDIARR